MQIEPFKIPAKYWYKKRNAIEIDDVDFLLIAHNMGFRQRGSHIYQFVQDSRVVIRTTRTAYFDAMRAIIPEDDPIRVNVLYALDQVIERLGYHLISKLQRLEDYYKPV